MNKHLILLTLLLIGIPIRMMAFGEDVEMPENDGGEEMIYKTKCDEIIYVLDNISSSKALTMIDEMRDYAEKHDSKYGFFFVAYLNAHIAKDMGMTGRAEELLLASIDYQKRYLSKIKPMTEVYSLLAEIYRARHQGEKAIQVLDKALKESTWSAEDRIVLLSLKCNAVTSIEPVDTARFMAYYDQLNFMISKHGYNGHATLITACHHAQLMHDYSRLLALAQNITEKGIRLKFKIAALDGLNRNQEAIDSFRVYKAWADKHFNTEMRKRTEISALELEAARAENEANTLRLTNQRMMLIAIVCGLILFTVFLASYLYRRQRQMRQLRQAYDKLEEAYDQLEQVTTQKERIESELRIARNIQLSMVPNVFPESPEIELHASMTPAKAVGGDLYDFFVCDNQLFFCIGDVSGKGVPAALFMMMTKSLFRAYSSEENMPDRIITRMNSTLCENNKSHMFVTLFVGVLELASGLLRYCNAGHPNPIVINKETSSLPVLRNFPVGFFADTTYQMQEAIIEPQTTILLYTDGLSEAKDADEQMFGDERIHGEVNHAIRNEQLSPKVLIDQLTQCVHHFVGDTEQSDDLTMLTILFKTTNKSN